jgi:mycothiol system anti-sigma-R factor
MNCREFDARLHAFVDGELDAGPMAEAEAHLSTCPDCHGRADGERRFRQLLRRQPRETAPPEFRARMLGLARRERTRKKLRVWLGTPALAAAVLLLAFVLMARSLSTGVHEPEAVASLVDKHLAYAQLEGPAEFSSTERPAVAAWFRQRTGLRVPVPDLSPAGIQLVGARIADADQRKVAYLFYKKGHVLMSVFMVPEVGRRAPLAGRPMDFGGHEYLAQERQGLRTVSWRDGQTLFSFVSTLDYDVLLECADQLRAERAREMRL